VKILVSNDDGYLAEGINVLSERLSKKHQVTIFAPSENKSASSSSLTIDKPLKPIKISESIYTINGTPSDSTHFALCGFFEEEFDLVIAGINFGPNMGDDVIYSGTVAAAIEGRFVGFPSIAISLASWNGINFDTAAKVAEVIADNVEFSELSNNTVLNINVPDIPFNEIRGFKTTRLGKRHKSENIFQDKEDTSLYWIGENGKEDENGPGTDFYAIRNNYVSITPLQIDLTNNNEIEKVDNWIKKII
jgi:5'-nucleotidase